MDKLPPEQEKSIKGFAENIVDDLINVNASDELIADLFEYIKLEFQKRKEKIEQEKQEKENEEKLELQKMEEEKAKTQALEIEEKKEQEKLELQKKEDEEKLKQQKMEEEKAKQQIQPAENTPKPSSVANIPKPTTADRKLPSAPKGVQRQGSVGLSARLQAYQSAAENSENKGSNTGVTSSLDELLNRDKGIASQAQQDSIQSSASIEQDRDLQLEEQDRRRKEQEERKFAELEDQEKKRKEREEEHKKKLEEEARIKKEKEEEFAKKEEIRLENEKKRIQEAMAKHDNPDSSSLQTGLVNAPWLPEVVEDISDEKRAEIAAQEAKRLEEQEKRLALEAQWEESRKQKQAARQGNYRVSENQELNVVRSTKFRHVFAEGSRKEICYVGLKPDPAALNCLKVNPCHFGMLWQGTGGRICIIPISNIGRLPDDLTEIPFIECGNGVIDFDFSPYNDNVLGTALENSIVQIWQIPEGGLKNTITEPLVSLRGHQTRTSLVSWHPTAENVLLSSDQENIKVWDIEKQAPQLTITDQDDILLNFDWNLNGSLGVSACKDKYLRTYDLRQAKCTGKTIGHDGAVGFKIQWKTNNDKLISVGADKNTERNLKLWDIRNLEKPVTKTAIDFGAGLITPYFDPDINVVYCSGKGDGNISVFEVDFSQDKIHYLNEYSSPTPAISVAQIAKHRVANVKSVEIARFIKLSGDFVEPLSFFVPRTRDQYFQDDIYVPTKDTTTPVLSSKQWFEGENKDPNYVDLKPEDMVPVSSVPVEKTGPKYTLEDELEKLDETDQIDNLIEGFYDKVKDEVDGGHLEQDDFEGVDEDEWDDY